MQAADLLGAGVVEREGAASHDGYGVGTGFVRVEQFGDAEVKQFRRAVGRDKDVGGFEIAMDDEVAVGVGYGFADFQEELAAPASVQRSLPVPGVERLARDVFHDEKGPSVESGSAIEKAGDVGVFEVGEDLAFVAETAQNVLGIHAVADEF